MKSANPQFGLVLTGGGAKGAYQAGALKYLAELGLEPQIIAGTNVGALNGAVQNFRLHCSEHSAYLQSAYFFSLEGVFYTLARCKL